MSITHDAESDHFVALRKCWILAVAQLKSVIDRTERSLSFARECQHHIDCHGHITPDELDRLSRQFLGLHDAAGSDTHQE